MTATLSLNAAKVCRERWQKKDETVDEMFCRVASHVALNDRELEQTFYTALSSFDLVPSSPIFTGSPHKNMAACFVLPVEDSLESIMETLHHAAQVQKWGGGCGFNFGKLRERGAAISTSEGKSCGPVGFMTGYNGIFKVIEQGGMRRGANGAQLPVDHPDIIEFITAKDIDGALSCFNFSVVITDEFMHKVKANDAEALVVWETLCASAWKTGEPGVLFVDTANRDNTVPHLYALEAVNPCGEFFLGPYECCSIASINLSHHVTKKGINWKKLQKTIETGTIFLDNVIDANVYIPKLSQFKDAQLRTRRLGLSLLGLADLQYILNVTYGSLKANNITKQIVEFIRYHAMRVSSDRAQLYGSFPAFKPEHYTKPLPADCIVNINRPDLDWSHINLSKGMRNASLLCSAPTGTASTVSEVEGYGCEPVFALAYSRTFENETLNYESPLFKQALLEVGISEKACVAIMQQVKQHNGSCQQVKDVPEAIRKVFVVSADISPENQVWAGAAVQKYMDNGVSQTITLQADSTLEDVKRAYLLGWETERKGLTVYRNGSRVGEPLSCASGECVVPPG